MRRFWPQLYVGIPSPPGRSNDETVLDPVTGLMWESRTLPRAVTFAEAAEHVAKLIESGHGGFCDWRFPTSAELLSLLPPHQDGGPDKRPTAFGNLPGVLWSLDRTDKGVPWRIDLTSRNIDLRTAERLHALQGEAYVRAVRTHSIWDHAVLPAQ
jgi:Protein of unknown function (DUF1566)